MMNLTEKREINSYTSDFKFQVVIETLSPNKNLPQVARKNHVPVEKLSEWKKKLIEEGPDIFQSPEHQSREMKELEPLEKVLGNESFWPW